MSGPVPYVGEIRLFAGTNSPAGWAFCNGATLSVAQFTALYSLIGTTYGGVPGDNFALPDLRACVPVGVSPDNAVGQGGGAENVALTGAQVPAHTHTVLTSPFPAVASPAGNLPGVTNAPAGSTAYLYGTGNAKPSALAPSTIEDSGGGEAHANIQPYLALNYIIALQGIYPDV